MVLDQNRPLSLGWQKGGASMYEIVKADDVGEPDIVSCGLNCSTDSRLSNSGCGTNTCGTNGTCGTNINCGINIGF